MCSHARHLYLYNTRSHSYGNVPLTFVVLLGTDFPLIRSFFAAGSREKCKVCFSVRASLESSQWVVYRTAAQSVFGIEYIATFASRTKPSIYPPRRHSPTLSHSSADASAGNIRNFARNSHTCARLCVRVLCVCGQEKLRLIELERASRAGKLKSYASH